MGLGVGTRHEQGNFNSVRSIRLLDSLLVGHVEMDFSLMIEIPCVFSAIKDSYTSKFHRNQQNKPRSYATLDPLCL